MRKNQFKKQGWFAVFKIPKFRLFGGVVAGLTFAFSLYALLYLMREIMRILSYSVEMHDLWVLPDETIQFYNLFFAFVSVIFGQSVCFNVWYDRPKMMFEHKDIRIANFLLSQRNLNWFFLFFLVSIARSIGVFFPNSYNIFDDFNLFPDFQWMLILIIIVLYAHSLMDYRPKFNTSGIKFISISLFSVVILSWGLSKVNLIDYHRINKKLQSRNLFVKYHFQLPVVPYAIKYKSFRFFTGNILLINANNPEFIYEYKPVSIEHLPNVLRKKVLKFREEERPLIHFNFMVDKSIKMQYINRLKLVLQKERFRKIIFNLPLEEYRFNKNSAFRTGLGISLKNVFSDSLSLVKKIRENDSIAQIIPLQLQASGQLKVQDSLWQSTAQIRNKLSKLMAKNPHTYFILKTDDEANFDAYARLLSAYRFSLDSVRQDYYKKHPDKSFMGVGIGAEETYPYLLFDLIE